MLLLFELIVLVTLVFRICNDLYRLGSVWGFVAGILDKVKPEVLRGLAIWSKNCKFRIKVCSVSVVF